MTQEILKNLNQELYNKIYILFAYYDVLFLYANKNTGELYIEPTGVLGETPIKEFYKQDFYTKDYFLQRKSKFLDCINKRPFQKANECNKLAEQITKLNIEREEKLFQGLAFYNGYYSAYHDFINEPMRFENLKIARRTIKQLEKKQ